VSLASNGGVGGYGGVAEVLAWLGLLRRLATPSLSNDPGLLSGIGESNHNENNHNELESSEKKDTHTASQTVRSYFRALIQDSSLITLIARAMTSDSDPALIQDAIRCFHFALALPSDPTTAQRNSDPAQQLLATGGGNSSLLLSQHAVKQFASG